MVRPGQPCVCMCACVCVCGGVVVVRHGQTCDSEISTLRIRTLRAQQFECAATFTSRHADSNLVSSEGAFCCAASSLYMYCSHVVANGW